MQVARFLSFLLATIVAAQQGVDPSGGERTARQVDLQSSLVVAGRWDEALLVTERLATRGGDLSVAGIRRTIGACRAYDSAGYGNRAIHALATLFAQSRLTMSPFEHCYAFKLLSPKAYKDYPNFARDLSADRRYCTQTDHRNRAAELVNSKRYGDAATELELQAKINPYIQDTYVIARFIDTQNGNRAAVLRPLLERYFVIETDLRAKCELWRDLRLPDSTVNASPAFARARKDCEAPER